MSDTGANGVDGAAFLVHLDSGEVEPMDEITLASTGLRERQDRRPASSSTHVTVASTGLGVAGAERG